MMDKEQVRIMVEKEIFSIIKELYVGPTTPLRTLELVTKYNDLTEIPDSPIGHRCDIHLSLNSRSELSLNVEDYDGRFMYSPVVHCDLSVPHIPQKLLAMAMMDSLYRRMVESYRVDFVVNVDATGIPHYFIEDNPVYGVIGYIDYLIETKPWYEDDEECVAKLNLLKSHLAEK